MRPTRLPLAWILATSFALAGCANASHGDSEAAPGGTTGGGAETVPGESTEKAPAKAGAKAEPGRESDRRTASAGDRGPDSNPVEAKLATQLNEATHELASLRVSNAKLKEERAHPAPDPVEERLALSFKSYAQFKQDLAGFTAEMEKVRKENGSLSEQLKDASLRAEKAKASLARMEEELKAEKTSRQQAEVMAANLRDQLRAIARAVAAAGLTIEPYAAAAEPTGRLEVSESRLRSNGRTAPARKYVVKTGDTLEGIAETYLGDRSKSKAIVEANRGRLPLDGTLPAGIELDLPGR